MELGECPPLQGLVAELEGDFEGGPSGIEGIAGNEEINNRNSRCKYCNGGS